ncbi:MAG: hypothetical protein JRJ87_24600 [Deltaproteobacteria bacterium]|nr:hypothetical protein [Deltaproteobacteria bacterium]
MICTHIRVGLMFALIFISGASWADIGMCVRYRISLIKGNAEKVEGFFQISSYDPMIELNNEKLLKHIRERRIKVLKIHKTIRTIEFPKLQEDLCKFRYSATPNEDIFEVPVDSITDLKIFIIDKCEHGNFPRSPGIDDFLVAYHADVITELNRYEIDYLQKKPHASTICRDKILGEFYLRMHKIHILSYNREIDQMDLKHLCRTMLIPSSGKKAQATLSWKAIKKQYKRGKAQLRKKKVVVFTIQFAD